MALRRFLAAHLTNSVKGHRCLQVVLNANGDSLGLRVRCESEARRSCNKTSNDHRASARSRHLRERNHERRCSTASSVLDTACGADSPRTQAPASQLHISLRTGSRTVSGRSGWRREPPLRRERRQRVRR
jgi:hypothetical protein